MHRCTSEITIGTLALHESGAGVESVTVTRSLSSLTQTAVVRFPRGYRLSGRPLEDFMSEGEGVRIRLGWDFDLKDEFVGYVRAGGIVPGRMVEVHCEDSMYMLKQGNVSRRWDSATLSDVLTHILDGVWAGGLDAVSMNLGPFRLPVVSPAEALQAIAQGYHQRALFRNNPNADGVAVPVLSVGKEYLNPERRTVAHGFQTSVISQNLQFVTADSLRLKFKAINILPDGTKQTYEFGDSDGAPRTLHFYNTPDYRAAAEAEAARLRYDGYRGSFTTWGAPYAEPGDIVTLTDDRHPEREGSYYIEATETTFSVSGGFRRTITLGKRA